GTIARNLTPPIHHAPRSEPLPLSFPQEGVWFLNELTGGNLAYNFQATIRFQGTLEHSVLEDVLSETVRRHEIFRTTFVTTDRGPDQIIHPHQRRHFRLIALRDY